MMTARWAIAASTVAAMIALGHGVGSATVDDFLFDLRNNGINGPDSSLVSLGQTVCAGKGSPQDQVVAVIKAKSGLDDYGATFLYVSANQFLCR